MIKRWFSSTSRILKPFKIAIVGSGPGGFYTAHHLTNKSPKDLQLNIDFFEKLPTPFGLSRYGVAPDHPEVKNCEEYLIDLMEDKKAHIRFIGNCEIGKDLTLKQLEQNYNSIILAYGCTSNDNKLNIPGSNLKNIISARKFVNWYNGHPEYYEKGKKFIPPPLDKIKTVTIIGNGNVALDVARVLLGSEEHWKGTDISVEAEELLEKSTVEHVRIVARRGIMESAFTNKEIRELFELDNVKFIPLEKGILESVDKSKLGRVDKRRISIIERYNNSTKEGKKSWTLEYLKSPVEFIGDEMVSATTFVVNKPLNDPLKPGKVVSTDQYITEENELVIESIGYQGTPINGFEEIGIWFDNNKLHNKDGRLLSLNSKDKDDHNAIFKKGWYTSGWIKNGPKGVIATTMMDSFDTADKVLEDIANDRFIKVDQEKDIIPKNSITWDNWKTLDNYELNKGKELGKTRYKVCDKQEMLKLVNK
ncbi:unnamed protein product [Candida verbasci]|uniref:NADPH:adrenodoxin oxidoreductase, mitochondrial n=1 Tax=Candida verbasci TaxID=1227364 RepID=A0A9W4TYM5_9ASCO|nr:unnamed protein product [Candida verbasci]